MYASSFDSAYERVFKFSWLTCWNTIVQLLATGSTDKTVWGGFLSLLICNMKISADDKFDDTGEIVGRVKQSTFVHRISEIQGGKFSQTI